MQKKILFVGLDNLALSFIKKYNGIFSFLGFDYDLDITNKFFNNLFIRNTPKIPLDNLFREADVVILNTDYSLYDRIFKSLPYLKNETLLLNTSSYKENIKIDKRRVQFIQCNFLLFPNNIIIVVDNDTQLQIVKNVRIFFESIKLPTLSISSEENNLAFTNLFQIPFLFQYLFLKEYSFYQKKDFIYNIVKDILKNNKNITDSLNKIINKIETFKIRSVFLDFMKEYNNLQTTNNFIDTENTQEVIIKIILEKIIMDDAKSNGLTNYFNLFGINFIYKTYSQTQIMDLITIQKSDIDIILSILIEKIKTLILSINFSGMTADKLIRGLS